MGSAESVMTTTTNGAKAYKVDSLGFDIEGDQNTKQLVSILTELWSATDSNLDNLVNKYRSLFESLKEIRKNNVEYGNMLLGLVVSYVLYKRDPRNGQGRRDESRAMLFTVCEKFIETPEFLSVLLRNYFNQGYWGDAKKILEITLEANKYENLTKHFSQDILEKIKIITCEVTGRQLKNDLKLVKRLEKMTNKDKEYTELVKQVSLCSKWVPLPKAKKGNGKDRTKMCITLAMSMFPWVNQNSYYNDKNGQKRMVNKNTGDYFRHLNLLTMYRKMVQRVRKYVPYIEKFTEKNMYSKINPSMLTSMNRMRLDCAIRNKPPRYVLTGRSDHIPKYKIKEMQKKYDNSELRFNNQDRIKCAKTYQQFEEDRVKKQQEKNDKIKNIREKIKNSTTKEEREKLEEELDEVCDEKVINFNAGTPIDVYKAYDDASVANPLYELCIEELITNKLRNLSDIPVLCIADTSSSMYSSYGKDIPIHACISLTSFFAKAAPEEWRHKFIQFSSNSYLIDRSSDDTSFFAYKRYMTQHQVNSGSTNFESVLDTLKLLFSGERVTIPKYLLFFSDMQFNGAVHYNKDKTPCEQLKDLFTEMGYDEAPTLIFWNLCSYNNRPGSALDNGVVMLSGYNPKMLLDLDIIINDTLEGNSLDEQYKNQEMINTWNTIVETLTTSEATVPLLEEMEKYIDRLVL